MARITWSTIPPNAGWKSEIVNASEAAGIAKDLRAPRRPGARRIHRGLIGMRAGQALRDNWVLEAAARRSEKRWPGYQARHWRAGVLRAQVIRRYVGLFLGDLPIGEALSLIGEASDRVRVVEQDGQFLVTARRGSRTPPDLTDHGVQSSASAC